MVSGDTRSLAHHLGEVFRGDTAAVGIIVECAVLAETVAALEGLEMASAGNLLLLVEVHHGFVKQHEEAAQTVVRLLWRAERHQFRADVYHLCAEVSICLHTLHQPPDDDDGRVASLHSVFPPIKEEPCPVGIAVDEREVRSQFLRAQAVQMVGNNDITLVKFHRLRFCLFYAAKLLVSAQISDICTSPTALFDIIQA